MTLPHDCEARLNMLRDAIERNRENLIEHRIEEKQTPQKVKSNNRVG